MNHLLVSGSPRGEGGSGLCHPHNLTFVQNKFCDSCRGKCCSCLSKHLPLLDPPLYLYWSYWFCKYHVDINKIPKLRSQTSQFLSIQLTKSMAVHFVLRVKNIIIIWYILAKMLSGIFLNNWCHGAIWLQAYISICWAQVHFEVANMMQGLESIVGIYLFCG